MYLYVCEVFRSDNFVVDDIFNKCIFHVANVGRLNLVVQPKFLGKLGLEIGFYKKAPPIGGTFGEVSECLRFLRSARRPRPLIGVTGSLTVHPTPKKSLSGRYSSFGHSYINISGIGSKILTKLRQQTCFQQVGQVLAQISKNVKALGFFCQFHFCNIANTDKAG